MALATDPEILAQLGRRLERLRLDAGITQADLADTAGVSKRTVERLEAGASVQLTNLVRVLRALGVLERFTSMIPEPRPRPLEIVERDGQRRRRAPRRKPDGSDRGPWTWDDDA